MFAELMKIQNISEKRSLLDRMRNVRQHMDISHSLNSRAMWS